MDTLINCLRGFAISKNERNFNYNMETIIKNFEYLTTSEMADKTQWEIIKSNYSKLKYLHETINFYYIQETDLFLECLERFMFKIDEDIFLLLKEIYKINIPETDREDFENIELKFQETLHEKDPIARVTMAVEAYSFLVPVFEKYYNETWKYSINDQSFIKMFSFKRKKLS